jgi:preprotein translocase subunit SecD
MKLPKIKLNLNVKPILNYILIIVVTALFLASIFIALPLTEKYVSKITYNLNPKDKTYWSQEFIVSTENTETKALNDLRNIFYKRLKGFGVEEVSTYVENDKIRIDVTTSKDKDLVKELISNKFAVKIVTRKSDVNFDDTNNTYAYMLGTNYDATEWDRSDFRNVYITKLRTSSGTYANFAIFKLWPAGEEKFNKFLLQYNGQSIGVDLDGFVTPHVVDATSKIFAIPISTENVQQLKVMSLLYNSGVVGTNFKIDSQTDLTVNTPKVNYIQVTLGILIAIVVLYFYLFISKTTSSDVLLKSLLATTLTISIYLAFLKIFQVPVDTFMLSIEAILAIIVARIIAEGRDSVFYIELFLLIILGSTIFLGNGFVSIIAQDMLILTALSKLCLVISAWYINKVKKI